MHTFDSVVSDLDLSSGESGNGTMTPIHTPPYLPTDAQCILSPDFRAELLPSTPVKDPTNILYRQYLRSPESEKTNSMVKVPRAATSVSPMANWIPNWEEYGSYILSPQNISTQRYVQGLPGGRSVESQGINSLLCHSQDDSLSVEMKAGLDLLVENMNGSSVNFCGNESDCSCDFEIIAEYTEPELDSSNLILSYDTVI